MKPYKYIKDAYSVVESMKEDLKYSKNKIRDAERINIIIDALTSFDYMLINDYKTDAIETLIYSYMYEILMKNKSYKKPFKLHTIIRRIENDIYYGADVKKSEVIDILKTHELSNKIVENTVFDKNYANFDLLLSKLMLEFKKDIIWRVKK